jgi:hypothetical protein
MPISSVPPVRSVKDLKWEMANLLKAALEFYQRGGELEPFERAVKLTREMFEAEMKPAANSGYLDSQYLFLVGASLEKVEAVAARWRLAQASRVPVVTNVR